VKVAPRLRPRAWGVRARVTIAASSVLALVVSLGAVALIVLVHQSLLSGLDSAATTRAKDVATLVSPAAPPQTLNVYGAESSLVQVIDSANSVVSSTENVSGESPILSRPPAQRRTEFTSLASLPVGNGVHSFRVAMEPVQLASGPGWIYVATSLSQVDAASSTLGWLLIAGLPALVVFVAATIWIAVGRSLRPVELIRKNAVSVGSNLVQRVAVPPSNDEIHRLAVTVNEMLDRLQASALRERRFVGDASHELRSPLAALRAQVEVALAHGDRLDARDALVQVESQAIRMTHLIDDLLFLARADEGRSAERFLQVDLDELVVAEAKRLREASGISVRLTGLDAVRIDGSYRDLERMLKNLGDNAVRHAHSLVEVELKLNRSHALITIANDGPVVPEVDRARIFDRFLRLDDSRTRGPGNGGSGLGLAIAQQIAHDHGGSIAAAASDGAFQGAKFTVAIPLGWKAPTPQSGN
jgi:signal transduction histidine kinase